MKENVVVNVVGLVILGGIFLIPVITDSVTAIIRALKTKK